MSGKEFINCQYILTPRLGGSGVVCCGTLFSVMHPLISGFLCPYHVLSFSFALVFKFLKMIIWLLSILELKSLVAFKVEYDIGVCASDNVLLSARDLFNLIHNN